MSGASLTRRRIDEYDRRPHSTTKCRSSARAVAPALAPRRSAIEVPSSATLIAARPVVAKYLWNAAAIAVAVAGLQRSDHCVDAPAVQSLSWRLSLAGVRLDGRTDICTRADTSVSVSFVLLSIVLDKVCLRNVFDPDTGRVTRAHQRRSLVSASRVVPQCARPLRGLPEAPEWSPGRPE